MASKAAHRRLTKEYLHITRNPPDYILAKPLESNILEWHYIIRGPPDSPYEGGEYWGKIVFPGEYPYKPPSIRMLTPNGRFMCDYRLCLSMSDYHPNTWNPAWSVSTILTGLLSFMLEDSATTGSIRTSMDEKRIFARKSHGWNIEQKRFRDVWPELSGAEMVDLPNAPMKNPRSERNNATDVDGVRRRAGLGEESHLPIPQEREEGTLRRMQQDRPPLAASHHLRAQQQQQPQQQQQQQQRKSTCQMLWRWLAVGVVGYMVMMKVVERVGVEV